jgi:hypothetical protein
MTKLLEQVLQKAAALPAKQQDALAKFLLAELADEAAWDAAFAGSQDELARMAREAIAEYKAGKTKPLNLSRGI